MSFCVGGSLTHAFAAARLVSLAVKLAYAFALSSRFPYGTTGSLRPTFVPARLVGLAVKLPSAFTLYGWFPISLREPLRASVTFSEVTAPVKLPTRQCSGPGLRVTVRLSDLSGWYFNGDSTRPSGPASTSPTYATQTSPNCSAKLQ